MMLLSWGAPLMPAGGSCCSLLKSLINLFLAGVDIVLFLLVVSIFLFLYLSRERDLTIIIMWVNLSKNKDPWERYRGGGGGGGGGFGFFFLFLFYWWGGVGWGAVGFVLACFAKEVLLSASNIRRDFFPYLIILNTFFTKHLLNFNLILHLFLFFYFALQFYQITLFFLSFFLFFNVDGLDWFIYQI